MSYFDQKDEKPSVRMLEELFQKALTCWNNLELDAEERRPKWPTLNGTKVVKLAEIWFCSSVLDTLDPDVIDLRLDFDYDYLDAGFAASEDHISVEIMFVDFLLHYLADELGYEFVEFTETTSSLGEETKNV